MQCMYPFRGPCGIASYCEAAPPEFEAGTMVLPTTLTFEVNEDCRPHNGHFVFVLFGVSRPHIVEQ